MCAEGVQLHYGARLDVFIASTYPKNSPNLPKLRSAMTHDVSVW
jgi:hypothetical protein